MVIEFVYLCRRLAARLVFVNAAPVNDGVTVGDALVQNGINNGDSLTLQGRSRFLRQLPAWLQH